MDHLFNYSTDDMQNDESPYFQQLDDLKESSLKLGDSLTCISCAYLQRDYAIRSGVPVQETRRNNLLSLVNLAYAYVCCWPQSETSKKITKMFDRKPERV